ncbi:acyl-CoA dehydrogenase family protein [Pseudorhodoferax sp. Leaf267]|uniref:acyl-CoA dehydrogenase family protein n=1 Tax=Pseudorhodoferax sp. Leaf267 TaxID=1736316 RepID=UPI0006F471E3|nr:acyl-CoA dehydrogenase family protein [Pseudorhodoferax sp. Leaf267]KQP17644.1 acyl-CoA dehydrogenase [Pseudorhodoferax sp. Leaf267]
MAELDLVETARHLLEPLRAQFDATVRAVAGRCSAGGRLDPRALDARQGVSYELAWASAELLACTTVLGKVAPGALDRALALLFATESIASVLARLEAVAVDEALDLAALRALGDTPAWAALRRAAAGPEALARTARALAASDGEIGPVRLSEDVAMAQQAFRRFGAEVVAALAAHIHQHDLTVPETLLGPLREMGVFGLSIPQEYGGSAPGNHDDTAMMIAVTEALSEASLGAAGSLITRPEILSRALLAGGTAAQKEHWLPRLAAGEPLCAIAMTEPDHGSDVASLALKATRVAGGWQLNGAKTWCTFAGKAGLLMVVARTDPDKAAGYKGLSILLVEKPSDDAHAFDFRQDGGGRLRGQAIPTIGYRGMHSYELAFEDVFVPDSHVLGGEAGLGKGFYFNMAGMVGGRMQTAARASGVMRAALRAALRYTQDRKVFGQPLIDFPLTQSKLARMAARFAACRQTAYAVGERLEEGQGRVEAAQIKLLACRSAELLTREALQLHGGMGYAEETPVSRYFVDARVLSIFEGAEETLALKVIARGLFEQVLAA